MIFRATKQWFMDIDHEGFRDKALAAIETVKWYPSESINRITRDGGQPAGLDPLPPAGLGVGIPAFYCNACDREVLTPESLAAAHRLVKSQGPMPGSSRRGADPAGGIRLPPLWLGQASPKRPTSWTSGSTLDRAAGRCSRRRSCATPPKSTWRL